MAHIYLFSSMIGIVYQSQNITLHSPTHVRPQRGRQFPLAKSIKSAAGRCHFPIAKSITSAAGRCPHPLAIYGEGVADRPGVRSRARG